MQSFAITIRKLQAPREPLDYVKYHAHILKSNPTVKFTTHVFEKNKNGHEGGHVHGIIDIPTGYYRKRLCLNGYHVKLVKITNLKGWIQYMKKDQSLFKKIENDLGQLKYEDKDEYEPTDSDQEDLAKYIEENKSL